MERVCWVVIQYIVLCESACEISHKTRKQTLPITILNSKRWWVTLTRKIIIWPWFVIQQNLVALGKTV